MEWPATYTSSNLRLREESIALKELLPIMLACAIWGARWASTICPLQQFGSGGSSELRVQLSAPSPEVPLLY